VTDGRTDGRSSWALMAPGREHVCASGGDADSDPPHNPKSSIHRIMISEEQTVKQKRN